MWHLLLSRTAFFVVGLLGHSARWRVSLAERLERFAVKHWVIAYQQRAERQMRGRG